MDHRGGEIANQIMCMEWVSEAVGRDGLGTRSLYVQGFPYCVEKKAPFYKTTRRFLQIQIYAKWELLYTFIHLYHSLLNCKYSRLYSSALKAVLHQAVTSYAAEVEGAWCTGGVEVCGWYFSVLLDRHVLSFGCHLNCMVFMVFCGVQGGNLYLWIILLIGYTITRLTRFKTYKRVTK